MKNTNIPKPPTKEELQEIVSYKLKTVYRELTEDIRTFEGNLYKGAYISIYDKYKSIKSEERKIAIVTLKFSPTANEVYIWENGKIQKIE